MISLGTPTRRGLVPRWTACLVAVLLLCLGLAHAATPSENSPGESGLHQAYWEDTSAQADFAQARTQTYTPYDGLLHRGYTASAIWVRLGITPPADLAPGERIVLRVGPNYLDRITLYDPLMPDAEPQQVGDRVDPALQAIPSLDFAFVLAPSSAPHAVREVWLRLHTTSAAMMNVEVLGESRFHVRESQAQLKAYAALALLGILWALVLSHWLQDRDRLAAWFLLRSLVYGAAVALQLGFGRTLLPLWVRVPPALLDQAFNYLIVLGTLLAFVFEIRLLSEYGMKPWARRCAWGLYLPLWCTLACLWVGDTRLALCAHAGICLFGVLLLLLICIFGLRKTHMHGHDQPALLSRKWLIAYCGGLCVFILSLVAYIGWGQADALSLNILLIYSLFSGILLVALLHHRAVRMRQRLHATDLHVALLRQQADSERQQREVQSRWLSLLMHEIKNPLAVIEVAQDRVNAGSEALVRKNVATIRHVLDRSLLLDKLEAGQRQTVREPCLLGEALSTVIDETGIDESRLALHHLRDDLTVTTDPFCLRILIGNLLGNAFKYGAPQGTVRLEVLHAERLDAAGVPQPWLGLLVANRPGPSGWPDPARVFEKHYRAEAARHTPGTGIGLYLVQQLAVLLGGECRYCPTPEEVRFELWLAV